jgi:ketosteroid isomerase-like protein
MARFVTCSILFFSCVAFAQVPAPASAPTKAPVTSTSSAEVQEFQKIEDAWADAINRRDQYSLENVLSPLFVDVSASGDITTRNQQLAFLIAGEDKTLHLTQRVITVRQLGEIAVANGTYVLHYKGTSGQVDEKGVFTHVFERARSGWVCLNSQRTVLREDNTNVKGKKQSNAEMPFHIPLFSKSDKVEKTDQKAEPKQ